MGLGYGSAAASADCGGCFGGRRGSVSGYLKLGGTLTRQLLLGVESNAWVKDEGGTTMTLGCVTGTLTFYPAPAAGVFLKGGVGGSYMSRDYHTGNATFGLSKTGWGLIAGLGYDLRMAKNVSITPAFNYWYGKPGDVDAGMATLPGWTQDQFDVTLGITFH